MSVRTQPGTHGIHDDAIAVTRGEHTRDEVQRRFRTRKARRPLPSKSPSSPAPLDKLTIRPPRGLFPQQRSSAWASRERRDGVVRERRCTARARREN